MRSSLLFLLLGACATDQAAKQCYPVSSFAAPVIACAAGALPAEPLPAPEPTPAPAPEPPPPAAELKDETIDLKEKVQFETNSATLLEPSKQLLDEVAKILKDHPELLKVQIEGHTDGQSANSYNLKLSQRRAASVRTYLISQGVEGDRLVAKGFGEEKPVASNDTEEGREQNRRVELRILKRK